MTKAENDYQYTLEKRIVDLEAEDRRLNFIIENYKQQFSLQGVSQQRELLIAFAKYMEEDKMYERHDEANVDDFLDNNSN